MNPVAFILLRPTAIAGARNALSFGICDIVISRIRPAIFIGIRPSSLCFPAAPGGLACVFAHDSLLIGPPWKCRMFMIESYDWGGGREMNLLPTDSTDNHEEIPHHTSKPQRQGRENETSRSQFRRKHRSTRMRRQEKRCNGSL